MVFDDLISVCVPAYNRPDTIERLIRSFLWQKNCHAELLITDDSPTDVVSDVVQTYQDQRIRYLRNDSPRGYCANLKLALIKARGAVKVILGDDDFFSDPGALTKYQSLFGSERQLVVAYTNRLQVTRAGRPDVVHRFFDIESHFQPGEDAWTNIWHRADCIAGLALRADPAQIEEHIPDTSILYPQSLLVGFLLGHGSAIGISDFLVAVSADESLLGYAVSRGDHIHGEERHGSMEYLDMVGRIIGDPDIAERVRKRIGRELGYSLAVTLPDEKVYCGTAVAMRNSWNLLRRSATARRHPLLIASTVATAVLPGTTLQWMKQRVKDRRNRKDALLWQKYLECLREIADPQSALMSDN